MDHEVKNLCHTFVIRSHSVWVSWSMRKKQAQHQMETKIGIYRLPQTLLHSDSHKTPIVKLARISHQCYNIHHYGKRQLVVKKWTLPMVLVPKLVFSAGQALKSEEWVIHPYVMHTPQKQYHSKAQAACALASLGLLNIYYSWSGTHAVGTACPGLAGMMLHMHRSSCTWVNSADTGGAPGARFGLHSWPLMHLIYEDV